MALLSFSELLIIASVLLFGLFILSLEIRKEGDRSGLLPSGFTKPIFSVILMLLSALMAITIVDSVPRPWYWFFVQGTLLLLILVAAEYIPNTLLGLLLASVSAITTLSIMLSEGISVIAPDQWGYYAASQMIVNDGNLARVSNYIGPYYALLPALPAQVAGMALLTNHDSLLAFYILAPLIAFVATLACVLISSRLPYGKIASVVSTVLVLSNARLVVWEIIPSILSVASAAVLILILHHLYTAPRNISRIAQALLLVGVFITTIIHPEGTIGILGLIGGLALAFIFLRRLKLSSGGSHFPGSFYIALALIPFLYWDFTKLITYLSSTQLVQPLINLLAFRSGSRVPLYEFGGDFAVISWSVPVALAFSFFFDRILRRKINLQSAQVERFLIACALVGILLVALGFLQRGSSAERYVSTPGFLLLILPGSFLLGHIFNSTRRLKLLTLAVLAVVIVSGSTSLSWAPDLYPNQVFEYSSVTEYVIASHIVHFLPTDLSLGALLSISDPLTANLAINGVRITLIGPFYEYVALNRHIDACTLGSFTGSTNSLFVVDVASLVGSCSTVYDVTFSSGTYVAVVMPR